MIYRLLGLFALPVFALAQDLGPEQLVKQITEEVLAALKSDKQLASGDRARAIKLAEEKILPHVDFEEATRLAVGRGWAQATPEQKKKLVQEFRNMLVRTYSNAIGAYEGQTMKVQPVRMKPSTQTSRCTTSSSAPAASRCSSTTRCARPTMAGRSTTSWSRA